MIYRPFFRLTLSALERPVDPNRPELYGKARPYALIMDPSNGESGIYVDGLPWDSEFMPSRDTARHIPGPLGLESMQTSETMQGHGASASFLMGEIGALLRDRVLPHDPLLVEILEPSTGRWRTAFDGHLSSIRWTKQSSPGAYRWKLSISAQGIQKVFSEQWLDWQAMIRAADNKAFNTASKGFSFFHDLARLNEENTPVSDLMRKFIVGAVDQFLEFGVRGNRAGIDRTFQTANGRDWQSAFGLFVFGTTQWYLMQRGPIWGMLSGLSEPDVHEFFITYAKDPSRSETYYRDLPTLVFRPRPWPGPPAASVTAKGGSGDDDSLWRDLDVVKTGLPGFGPAAFSVGTSRNDASRTNAFFISIAGATDSSPGAMDAAKLALGFRVDEGLVKRYGFSMRQVSIGSYLKRSEEYFDTILPAVLDRVAWQEAPLPFLLDQTRSFPLMPGVHVGSVLEDYSEDQSLPTTGYIISVEHSFSGSTKSLHAETKIGTTRAIEGVTAANYPEAVRRFVGIQYQKFIDAPGQDELRGTFVAPKHSQPAPVAPVGPDDLQVTDRPHLQDTPNKAAQAELSRLRLEITKVKIVLGAITITSVYRSVALNRFVGGRADSDHLFGRAFDFQVAGGAPEHETALGKLVAQKGQLEFKEIVLETKGGKTWLHYAIPRAGDPPARRIVDGAQTGD